MSTFTSFCAFNPFSPGINFCKSSVPWADSTCRSSLVRLYLICICRCQRINMLPCKESSCSNTLILCIIELYINTRHHNFLWKVIFRDDWGYSCKLSHLFVLKNVATKEICRERRVKKIVVLTLLFVVQPFELSSLVTCCSLVVMFLQ